MASRSTSNSVGYFSTQSPVLFGERGFFCCAFCETFHTCSDVVDCPIPTYPGCYTFPRHDRNDSESPSRIAPSSSGSRGNTAHVRRLSGGRQAAVVSCRLLSGPGGRLAAYRHAALALGPVAGLLASTASSQLMRPSHFLVRWPHPSPMMNAQERLIGALLLFGGLAVLFRAALPDAVRVLLIGVLSAGVVFVIAPAWVRWRWTTLQEWLSLR